MNNVLSFISKLHQTTSKKMFERPKNLEFPQIYYNFHSKNGEEFYVQDLTEEFYESAIELMIEDYLFSENLAVGQKIPENPAAVDEFRKIWRKIAEEKLSIACFKTGSNELVAVNFLKVTSIDDKTSYKCQTNNWNNLFHFFNTTMKKVQVFEKFNVDQYLSGYGLVVRREFRFRGIATEMIKARVPFMKNLGLKVTATAFTALGSQKAALLGMKIMKINKNMLRIFIL